MKNLKAKAYPKFINDSRLTKYERKFICESSKFFESVPDFEDAVLFPVVEPITFHTGNVNYRCDFFAMTSKGRLLVVEVKASNRQRGYHYSRARMAAAAAMLPVIDFIVVFVDEKVEPHKWKYELFR